MLCWGHSWGSFIPLQQTIFIVSGSSLNPLQGKYSECYAGVIIILGVIAALQHNLFIVSVSPSNPNLGEVTQTLCWGHNSPWG